MLPALRPLCSQWLVDYFATESTEFTEKFVLRRMELPSRPGIAHAAFSVSSVISVAYRLLCHREHRVHREVRVTPDALPSKLGRVPLQRSPYASRFPIAVKLYVSTS